MEKQTERIHIYLLPEVLSTGYCFDGSKAIAFLNVDWFDGDSHLYHRSLLINHVKTKSYFIKGRRYLMLGETFAEIIT